MPVPTPHPARVAAPRRADDPRRLRARVESAAAAAGIDALGVTDATPLAEAADAIERVKSRGLHAGMHFTFTDPQRSTQPTRILPGARSVVVGVRRYRGAAPDAGTGAAGAAGAAGAGAVAAYVVEDEYGPLAAALESVAAVLRAAGEQAVVVLDDNRLADRAVAYRAGLGWFGRNTMLLHPDLGSWTVLGSVVTTAALPADAAPVPDGCGSCRRCVPACPTGALGTDASGAAVLDADLCLAWQLQADGVFARGLRVALGDRLYGCDDCQVVCPCNDEPSPAAGSAGPAADASSGAPHDWAARRGDNPLSVRGRTAIDVAEMLLASDDALTAAFGHWYIPRRRPEYLRRNALVVLGNTADAAAASTRKALRTCLRDASPIVRSHAVWAAHRLGLGGLVAEVPAGLLLADDPDGMVALELRDPPAAAPPRPRT